MAPETPPTRLAIAIDTPLSMPPGRRAIERVPLLHHLREPGRERDAEVAVAADAVELGKVFFVLDARRPRSCGRTAPWLRCSSRHALTFPDQD